ncbi:fasciclin domain-containing protein [Fulvivirga sp.]|uniref:fasciclin domain-containing protein n=1 Tax=Fulvivirga sp. TaxID=1931237 RepID=UPI0032EACC86
MKNFNLTSLYSKLIAIVLVGSMLGFMGCGDDDDGTPAPTLDIVALAATDIGGSDGLDSLVKYLSVYPDLVALLQSDGPFTVFAPTNAAFISLLQTPGFPQDIRDIDPDIVKGVLAYHVVAGENRSNAVVSGASFNSSFTDPNSGAVQTIEVNSNGTLKTGSTNQEIEIIEADLLATNGVIHKVESVMIPPSVGATLTPILGTLAGTVLLGADFSYLADLIAIADSEVPSGQTPISSILASPPPGGTPTITAFVPPNAVFAGAAAMAGVTVEQFLATFTPASARATLLTHVTTDGAVASSSLEDGDMFATALNPAIMLTITVEDTPTNSPTGVLVAAPGNANPVPVVIADINHSNGIAHVIGGVLQPQ